MNQQKKNAFLYFLFFLQRGVGHEDRIDRSQNTGNENPIPFSFWVIPIPSLPLAKFLANCFAIPPPLQSPLQLNNRTEANGTEIEIYPCQKKNVKKDEEEEEEEEDDDDEEEVDEGNKK